MNHYYTIPSNNRELRHGNKFTIQVIDYTIPSNNRELRQKQGVDALISNYTIPSNNRELRQLNQRFHRKRIIPYQVITGNYD